MAVGIKEVFELPAATIEDRFLCAPSEGAAMLVVGDCTHGYTGGGFLYTNKDSISLGLVATIEHLQEADTTIYQMMDDFKDTRDEIEACATCFNYPDCIWLKLCKDNPYCYQEERSHKFIKLRQSMMKAYNSYKDKQEDKQEDEMQDEVQD